MTVSPPAHQNSYLVSNKTHYNWHLEIYFYCVLFCFLRAQQKLLFWDGLDSSHTKQPCLGAPTLQMCLCFSQIFCLFFSVFIFFFTLKFMNILKRTVDVTEYNDWINCIWYQYFHPKMWKIPNSEKVLWFQGFRQASTASQNKNLFEEGH